MRMRSALVLALGVAVVAALGVAFHQYRQLAAARQQRAADLETIHTLQQALRQQEAERIPAAPGAPPPADEHRAALARRDAAIEQLKQELSQAQSNIAQLQAQLLNAGDQRDKALASADERFRKEQADWQSRLDALQQEVDAARDEAKTARLRVAELETANAKLLNDASEGSARTAETARTLTALQNLDQRREAYLTSIIRRYRDITSQFRAMSGMLDTSRDGNSSAFSGAALLRIQNAISLADDDLRQLSELNAQAAQLEKKLQKK